jgi:oxygen-dependent protoporphyrinogen oxidase
VATVALAYPDKALSGPLKGYGYLRPRAEGGPIVACTWVSSKWPGRAPEGFVLIRAFVGRAGVEDAVSLSDRDLLGLVQGELHEVLGTNDAPALSRIHRWPRGMPQYTLGHSARLAEVEHRLALYPGLQVAGQSYHGIGIPDCIRSGERAADRLLAQKPVVTA